jgi:hypothetical protein
MRDRFWPARRWLADRLIGDHAYSKNVAPQPGDWIDTPPFHSQVAVRLVPASMTYVYRDLYEEVHGRNPGETA